MAKLDGHFMIEALGSERADAAHDSAYRLKALRLISPGASAHADGMANLERAAEVCEMAAIDRWKSRAPRGKSGGPGEPGPGEPGPGEPGPGELPLEDLCRQCFGLLEACPVPEEPAAKFSHLLRLFAYAHMGDRWEAMRRYVSDHAGELRLPGAGAGAAADGGWEHAVMSGVHGAVLRLAGMRSAEDLGACASAVEHLRSGQRDHERAYLEALDPGSRLAAAHRLSAMYHLAKSVELLAGFVLKGSPDDVEARLDFHFDKAVAHSGRAGSAELDVLLRIAHPAFRKMAHNSVWVFAKRAGGRVAELVRAMSGSDRPVFEFLYPQREVALDGGLLDPAHRAMLINLPTSGGKTLLAEFKIVQAASGGGGGSIVAYTVPTRALVNQIAARLRRDLGPLGMRVEKMSGALDIDGFEDRMLAGPGRFDVLVTTPEKLMLLVRSPEYNLAGSLSLCIVDEAHNLGDGARGVNLEMLITTIKRDCKQSGLLLLTPFIPNSDDVAKWIDPHNPRSVKLGISWMPNDRMVGAFYAEGRGKSIETFFRPLATSARTIEIGGTMRVGKTDAFTRRAGRVKKTMEDLTSLLATQIDSSRGLLVLGRTIKSTWNMADLIYNNIDAAPGAEGGRLAGLAKKFVASELGGGFPLARYLDKGIGVHHAGLPDEVRFLMERLMESGRLRILVGTTTIAQGLNFPVSGILVSSYWQRREAMRHSDFWNLLGRAGRIDQPSLGVVGIAVDGARGERMNRAARYVQESTEALSSGLEEMVSGALSRHSGLDLSQLAGEPGWSSFVQYIAHMKNQSASLDEFVSESEITLRQTFGYGRLDAGKQRTLLGAIRDYAASLDARPDASRLSDLTGFSPESVERAADAVRRIGMRPDEWSGKSLFAPASGRLAGLIGVMLDNIPEVGDMDEGLRGSRRAGPGAIAGIVADWVGGKAVADIARDHFGGTDQESVTACVRAIYGRIIQSATWGLAGMQRIHGFGLERGADRSAAAAAPADPAASARNLPAMVYHGVDTDEAVLMRMNAVPRSVAKDIGQAYAEHLGGRDVHSAGSSGEVIGWLAAQPDEMWRPRSRSMTGRECRLIWGELAGVPVPEKA